MVGTGVKEYFIQFLEMEDYNVMIDGQNFFDQPVKINIRTYSNIRKIMTTQEDDYTTGCLLFYRYFNERYKIIALDADLKTIQKISSGIHQETQQYFPLLKKKKKTFKIFHNEL